MPIQNDDDVKVDTTPEVLTNVSEEIKPLVYSTVGFDDYEFHYDEDEDDLSYYEERFFLKEEDYYSKLGHKFVARGYKRPLTFRGDTRRKYKNFRETKKIERRYDEKFNYRNFPVREIPVPTNILTDHTVHLSRNKTVPISSTAVTPVFTNPASSTSTIDTADNKKYLSTNEELEYQEALRHSSAAIVPTTGISLQQLLELCNRDLTPEDYELLLRLDETVEKKTVKQETLSSLSESTVESESQCSELCTICMCNYGMGEKIKNLPCTHFFHVDCIVPYLSSYGQSCPVCKAKV